MREIHGTYIEKGKEVEFIASIPGNWDELDKYQFSRIREILTFTKADKYTIATSFLTLLFGPKNFHILAGLDDELRYELYPLVNFIHDEKPPLKNFFPSLNIKKKNCIPPETDLSNLSFGEWCFAHQYYFYYTITRDESWLNYLIATLYRPLDPLKSENSADYDGDRRIKFNENLIEKAAKGVANIQYHIKLAIYAWFGIAVENVASTRRNVFPVPIEGEEVPQSTDVMPQQDWMSIFRNLIGPKFGTQLELKYTNAMFVLDYMEDQHVEFKKALAKK